MLLTDSGHTNTEVGTIKAIYQLIHTIVCDRLSLLPGCDSN